MEQEEVGELCSTMAQASERALRFILVQSRMQ